jgi:hypothetical protein
VARVWDALFSEGSKILFRTALAVLKAQEETLLAFDNAGEQWVWRTPALNAGLPLAAISSCLCLCLLCVLLQKAARAT